uniref:DDE_3 domain-containing protein n=1 Tax=Haemonchus contortus TaxID=6289 RepID=A0A7I5EEC4_HAECO
MSKEMDISRSSLRRIVKEHLHDRAFKRSRGHFLSEQAKLKRKDRSQQLLHRFQGDRHREVLFFDEKVFTVEQVLNKQNDRIYAKSKPKEVIQRKAHPLSLMVFAGITAEAKTPLIFVPQGVKVNGEAYLGISENQQDGAPGHKSRIVQEFCRGAFPDFIAFDEWPPDSPDLNPMNFSVWSTLEAKACAKPHNNSDSLKKALQKAWDQLDASYLRATVDAFPRRLQACVDAEGDRFQC